MAKNYGGEPQRDALVRKKYGYLVCRGTWNAREHRHSGCGKLFTADSLVSVCPDCGTALSHVTLSRPPERAAARVLLEKCAKCAYSLYAPACLGGYGTAAKCGTCRCRECCREETAKADAVLKGGRSLMDLVRENIRKREAEEAEKDRVWREKNGVPAAALIETAAKKKPMAGLVAQAVTATATAVAATAAAPVTETKRTDGGDETPLW
jgi:hypothetical protein